MVKLQLKQLNKLLIRLNAIGLSLSSAACASKIG